MDRFDSTEDAPAWAEAQFDAGKSARLAGAGRDSVPGDLGGHQRASWLAGWTDTAAGIEADAEAAEHVAHGGCANAGTCAKGGQCCSSMVKHS